MKNGPKWRFIISVFPIEKWGHSSQLCWFTRGYLFLDIAQFWWPCRVCDRISSSCHSSVSALKASGGVSQSDKLVHLWRSGLIYTVEKKSPRDPGSNKLPWAGGSRYRGSTEVYIYTNLHRRYGPCFCFSIHHQGKNNIFWTFSKVMGKVWWKMIWFVLFFPFVWCLDRSF